MAWFVVFAGPKSVLELHRARRSACAGSAADTLAGRTRVPGFEWVPIFGPVNIVCLFEGAGIRLG